MLTLLDGPNLSLAHDYWKTHCFDYMDFIGKVMSLLLNTLSMFVIGFPPRSKHLLCLRSPSAVILVPKKTNSATVSFLPYLFATNDKTRCHDLSFLNVEF